VSFLPKDHPFKTVRDWLRFGASRLGEGEVDCSSGQQNPMEEARFLIAKALHLPHPLPDELLDAALLPEEGKRVADWLRWRIEDRVPAAYLAKEAWFDGLSFYVDERVLIPRSLFENLFSEVLPEFALPLATRRILEIGTGSGAIAVALALHYPEAEIVATDISADALAVAAHNIQLHDQEGHIELRLGDLFEPIAEHERFDLIVSNPPYVSDAEMADRPPEYRHEPDLALAAGEDGLEVVIRLLEQSAHHLNDCGYLMVEVGFDAQSILENRLPEGTIDWLPMPFEGSGVFAVDRSRLNGTAWRDLLAAPEDLMA